MNSQRQKTVAPRPERLRVFSWMIFAALVAGAPGRLLAGPVTLVREGRAAATIIVPDHDPDAPDAAQSPAATAREAAEVLKKRIAEASGAELPVRPAAEAPAEGTLVLVGRSALSERYGLEAPSGSEAARVATFSRGLAIIGEIAPPGTNNRALAHDRGTMHGVHLFLEKQVGFRFYFALGADADLGTVTPDSPTITVGPVDETFAPAFPYRLKHRWNQDMFLPGSGTGFRCNHTHEGWDRHYRENHPEYFSLQADGSRDFRSLCYGNPDVLARELEHIETYLETGRWVGSRAPTEKYIQVEPVDNWRECRCEKCQAWIDPEGGRFRKHARLWWDHYIRELALQVSERWPEMRVSSLAYQGRLWPGEKDLPDNVDVMACIHNAPVNFMKEENARRDVEELLGAWSRKLGGDRERLYVWDYPCYPSFWTCAPMIYPNLQQRFLLDHRELIGGQFHDGCGDTIQNCHYMTALKLRLLWDPDLDTDAWLEDYCRNFFGPAAGPMEKVYRLLIDRYEQVGWPEYHQPSHTAWASPGMFYGRTFTPEVVARAEQLLVEAQEAAGGLPGGLAAEFGEGEGWFVRRNGADGESPFEIVLEALDRPVNRPTVRWEGGEMVFRDTLSRGRKLVVAPGPVARMLPVTPVEPPELVPPPARLDGVPVDFSAGYIVHSARNINVPAYPGAQFRLTVRGRAEGGANSLVAVQWSTGRWTNHLENRFGSEEMTVSEVISAPEGVRGLRQVNLYRLNREGTVSYGDLSLRRVFPESPGADLPTEGVDVTAAIEGDAPVIPGRTTFLFHVFPEALAPGVAEAGKIDLHLAGTDPDPAGETAAGPGTGSGMVLRATVRPVGEAPGDGPPTIYQRRVAWMRDSWENFRPNPSMYAQHYGFLAAARTAHRWIGHAPEYRVARTARAPRPDPADPAWREASAAELVRGRSRAQVPADNLGFPAGNAPTLVRFLRDEENLYAYFQCFQPEPPGAHDLVTLALYRPGIGERGETISGVSYPGDNPVFSVSARPGEPESSGPGGAVLATAAIPGGWAAFMTVPAAAVPGGLRGEYRADLLRAREGGLQYLWSPPLDAPWVQMPMARRGRLVFEAR